MNTKGVNFQPSERGQFSTAVDNHHMLRWLKTVVLNGVGKGAAVIVSGMDRKDERWVERPSAD